MDGEKTKPLLQNGTQWLVFISPAPVIWSFRTHASHTNDIRLQCAFNKRGTL